MLEIMLSTWHVCSSVSPSFNPFVKVIYTNSGLVKKTGSNKQTLDLVIS